MTVLPVEMTVRQRSTAAIPGSGGRILLTVGDITRGQVITSLATDDNRVLLAPTSLSPGRAATFRCGDGFFALELATLYNALIGDDFATFVVADAEQHALAESGKIDRLLELVETLEGAVFLRNDAEHAPGEAAGHLRSKRRAAAQEITSARQFIDLVASRSSTTGDPYRIRLADGSVVELGAWLHDRLIEIEGSRGRRPPGG